MPTRCIDHPRTFAGQKAKRFSRFSDAEGTNATKTAGRLVTNQFNTRAGTGGTRTGNATPEGSALKTTPRGWSPRHYGG
ncbi:hypothetical protein MTP99_012896 [Tenebrio molitor]|nr:hypothetical protein MTP99_012896 [Tenebrio molitor]